MLRGIFRTYSCYARADEGGLTYCCLDITPKGRGENGPTYTLGDWVRRHDHYEAGGHVTAFARYVLRPLDSSPTVGRKGK
jgi:uncharacterized protein DUF899